MDEKKIPRVGIAMIILKEQKVLLGKRKGSLGEGTWSFPGGKLEYHELSIERALTELSEETGLKGGDVNVIDFKPSAITEDIFPTGEHYITLYLRAQYLSGNPRVIEKDKCEEWEWYPWEKLPNNLFLPVRHLIKQEYNPFKLK